MPLDASDDHQAWIRAILARFVPDREVWAFGSRTRGTARKTSDLDLCVVGDRPLGFDVLGQLKDAFSESDLPYKVDVVDWATLNPDFQAIVHEHKVVVQAGDRAT